MTCKRLWAMLLAACMILSLAGNVSAAQPQETPAPDEEAQIELLPDIQPSDPGESDPSAFAAAEEYPAAVPDQDDEADDPEEGFAVLAEDLTGSGSQDEPYLIYTEEDLAKVDSAPAAYYRLERDITLTADPWTPLGLSKEFSGVFDGNGHKITGLSISGTSNDKVGLFAQTSGTIKNLTVEGNVSGKQYVGILAGFSRGPITNCFTSGSAANTASYGDTGGLVGYHQSGIISACGSTAKVSGSGGDYGGLIGDNQAQVSNCYAQGSVSGGNGTCGGLIGNNSAYVSKSYASGSVTCTGNSKGGLNGSSGGYVYDCYCRNLTDGNLVGFYVSLADLKVRSTFTNWDFDKIWAIDDGLPYINYRGSETIPEFEGDGSQDEPYLIKTEIQLYWLAMNYNYIANDSSANYKLANDIEITSKYWTPIGEYAEFKANFDGDGHKITGLSLAGTSYDKVGLFGEVSGKIKNLTVEGNVSGKQYVGILAGFSRGPITNCFTSGTAANTASYGDTGGLVGYHQSGIISACGSTAKVSGSGGDYGGLIGDNQAQVSNCYAQGSVSGGGGTCGGLIGNNSAYVSKSYASGSVTCTGNSKGGLNGSSGGYVYDCYCRNLTDGNLVGFYVSLADLKVRSTFTNWDFDKIWAIDDGLPYINYRGSETIPEFEGDGSQDEPYLIKTEIQLYWLAMNYNYIANDSSANYKLANDIEITSKYWTPIGEYAEFKANFDGDGHKITGLSLAGTSYDKVGLFGEVSGKIKNLTVEGNLSGKQYVGILAGFSRGPITNCFTSGTAANTSAYGDTGGLVGYHQSGIISACGSTAKVSGSGGDYGGLIGDNQAQVSNCYAQGSVSGGGGTCGGLIGNNSAYVSKSYASGSVTCTGNSKGGLNGSSGGYVYDCYCRTLTDGNLVGHSVPLSDLKNRSTFVYWDFDHIWAIGDSYPYINYRGAASTVTFEGDGSEEDPFLIKTEQQLNWLAMNYSSTANNSSAWYQLANDIEISSKYWTPIGEYSEFKANFDGAGHKVTGLSISGTSYDYVGLFGQTSGTIKNLTVEGNVSGKQYVGILAGFSKGPITNCFTSGAAANTSAYGDTGGLVGYHQSGVISACGSAAKISGSGGDYGGLIGDNQAQVSNCYAQGSVSGGGGTCGGLIGYNNAYVSKSYASGSVTCTGNSKGGLTGSSGGYIYDCYSLAMTDGNLAGFSVSRNELKDRSTFVYWDFDKLWAIDDGYPYINYRGAASTVTYEGDGSEEDPFLIKTEKQLYWLALNYNSTPNNSSAFYKLANDITITSKYWTPIGEYTEFKANFDGDGHKITGISVSGTNYEKVGLFGEVSGAVKNLTVEGSVSGKQYVGILAGISKGTITNCAASGTATNTTAYGDTGGLVGYNSSGAVSMCWSAVEVSAKSGDCGGLIGNNQAKVSDSYARGSVSGGSATTGGLVGRNTAGAERCYAANTVTSTSTKGGLLGYGGGTVTSSYYDCEVSGLSDTGKGEPTSTSDMKKQSVYEGWDFSGVWGMDAAINNGYPYLLSNPPAFESAVQVTGVSLDKSELNLHVGDTATLKATVLPSDAANTAVTWTSSDENVATVADGEVTAVSSGSADITVTTSDGGFSASCKVTSKLQTVNVQSGLDYYLELGDTLDLSERKLTIQDYSLIVWSSSDSSVASISRSGLITALKLGETRITGTAIWSDDTYDNSYTFNMTVYVCEPVISIESVELNTDHLEMNPGDSTVLTAIITPSDASRDSTSWTSSDESVVSVDENGTVTAVGTGDATITFKIQYSRRLKETAAAQMMTAECTVTVTPAAVSVESVSLDKTELDMNKGDTATLSATVMPEDAADKAVTWQSSNAQVAAVKDGVVRAVSAGTATITVTTADGGKEAHCKVTVTDISSTITLNKQYIQLMYVDDVYLLEATVTPNSSTPVEWTSANEKIATVTQFGLVTARKSGETTIIARTPDGAYTTCNVKVQFDYAGPTNPKSLSIYPTKMTMVVGSVQQLTININDPYYSARQIFWYFSDPEVATVRNYYITALKPGTTSIVLYMMNGGLNASCEVTVIAKPSSVDHLELEGPTNKDVVQGSVLDVAGLVVTAVYSDGSRAVVTDYDISGYDPSKLGAQTVTVSFGGQSATFGINVVARAVTGIAVTSKPSKLNYAYGEELDRTGLTVTAVYNDGTSAPVTGYTLSGYSGAVPGTQTVTVSYQGFSAWFNVTVGEKPVTGNVTKPTFAIESFIGGKRITLTAASGAAMYYTLDGTTPTTASAKYSSPIELTTVGSFTVKAIAVQSGVSSSAISAKITVSQVAAPTAAPAGGTVEKGSIVSLRTDTVGAAIYYTTDGSAPSASGGTSVKYNGAVFVTGSITLKAIAVKDGYVSSAVISETYTVPEAPADEVTIALGSVTVPAGNTASVPVYIFADGDVSAFRFSVSYESGKFDSNVTVTPAEGVDPSELFTAINSGLMTIMYTGDSPVESGEVCTVNLTTLASLAPDTYCSVQVLPDRSSVTVVGYDKVELTTADAGITVTESALSSEGMMTANPDGSYDASISIYNDAADSSVLTNANLYLAVYDRDGRMISVNTWVVDISDPMYLLTQTINIPQGMEVGSVKIMLTSGDLTPLTCPMEMSGKLSTPQLLKKPIIYLYPEEELEATVTLECDGELTCTYPAYDSGWTVTASPDGTLTDRDGKSYSCLFWEARSDIEFDFSRGFCVAGKDTAAFLEDALAKLGLDRREANEFIIFWLPMMQDNPWNLITFQGAAYADAAKLTVTPQPDTVIRVFMAWKALEQPVSIEAQTLSAPARTGFTVVEWGGAEVEG